MGEIVSVLAEGVPQTLGITVISFVIAIVGGLPLAILRRSGVWIARLPAVLFVEVLRAVPPIVWLFVIYYSVGNGAITLSSFQAAVIGLGLIYGAHMSEVYRAGLDAVPTGQWDAVHALALPRRHAYQQVILPQAFLVVVPPMATFGIALLKDSAVASVIGVSDITFHAVQLTQQDLNGFANFAVAGVLYILLSLPFALLGRAADRALARRLEGR